MPHNCYYCSYPCDCGERHVMDCFGCSLCADEDFDYADLYDEDEDYDFIPDDDEDLIDE